MYFLLQPEIDIPEIQKDVLTWLKDHPQVTQKFFGWEVVRRQASTFSNLLTTKQNPTTEVGKGVWRKMKAFLLNPQARNDLCRKASFVALGKSIHNWLTK